MESTTLGIERYLCELSEPEEPGLKAPDPILRLCVVIPALAESRQIERVLASLSVGSMRTQQVEVLVLVNNAQNACDEIKADNQKTLAWLSGYKTSNLRILPIDRATGHKAFPNKVAGVGAARRAGMDIAFRRLVQAGCPERSAIACLDADSPVAPGYLDQLLDVFDKEDQPLVGICPCKHEIPTDPLRAQAIVGYELWLRYVEWGMHFCGSPYAFQTIGSCMVVSVEAYAMADGMPRRQAGEDFYFLQKLAKRKGSKKIVILDNVTVHPSARVSHRVPFGTGRAMLKCEQQGKDTYLWVEPAQAYRDLRPLLNDAPEGFVDLVAWQRRFPEQLSEFLQRQKADSIFLKLRENSSGPAHFKTAVNAWFDSLKVVRYSHFCTQNLGRQWLFEALFEIVCACGRSDLFLDLPRLLPPAPSLEQQVLYLKRFRVHHFRTG